MAKVQLDITVNDDGSVKVGKIATALDKADKSAESARKSVFSFGGAVEQMAIGAQRRIGELILQGFTALATAVSAAAQAVVAAGGRLLEYSDKMVTLSQRTGLSTTALQLFERMAKDSGTSVEAIANGTVKMSAALYKGNDSFARLGLSVSQLKAMSPEAAFTKIGTAIGSIEDPMQRSSAAVSIFGKAGAELLPVFAMNLEEVKKNSDELHLSLSEKLLTSTEGLGDTIGRTQDAFEIFLFRLAAIVLQSPAAAAAIEELGTFFGDLSQEIEDNEQALIEWANYAVGVAADMLFALTWSLEKAITAMSLFTGVGGNAVAFAADKAGVTSFIGKIKELSNTMKESAEARVLFSGVTSGASSSAIPEKKKPGTFFGTEEKKGFEAAEKAAKKLKDALDDLARDSKKGWFETWNDGLKDMEENVKKVTVMASIDDITGRTLGTPLPQDWSNDPEMLAAIEKGRYAAAAAAERDGLALDNINKAADAAAQKQATACLASGTGTGPGLVLRTGYRPARSRSCDERFASSAMSSASSSAWLGMS